MQRGFLELCLIITVVIGIHAERLLHSGTIVGKISPGKSSSTVIAIRGNDSVKVIPYEGRFGMELQPGDWKLIFADNQYHFAEKRVQVQDGQHINLGEIRLAQ